MNTILYFKYTAANAVSAKLDGVLEAATELGWHVQVVKSIPSTRTLQELIRFWHPLGAIADCGAYASGISLTPFSLLPSILIDPPPTPAAKPFHAITQDSVDTGSLAARELMSLGYESFAFIHHVEPCFWSREREQGFVSALRTNGYSAHIFRGVKPKSSPRATSYLRKLGHFISSLARPCALFVANDITALEVYGVIHSLDFRIPEDFGILSVDNHENICETTTPTLSSIQPDFRKCGHTAVHMLKAIIDHPERLTAPVHETFRSVAVIRRGSTRRRQGMSSEISAALELIRRKACTGLMAQDVVSRFSCPRPIAEARFRKAVGHSILEEIQEIRLAKAKELLMNPLLPMKAISDFCGFKTPNSLSRFFRLKTGQSMTAWRRGNRQIP